MSQYPLWVRVVTDEYKRFINVKEYLSRDGLERYRAFLALASVASECRNATQLIEKVRKRRKKHESYLDMYLSSIHLETSLKWLENIAKREEK